MSGSLSSTRVVVMELVVLLMIGGDEHQPQGDEHQPQALEPVGLQEMLPALGTGRGQQDTATRSPTAPPGDTMPWSTAGTRSECHKELGPRNEVEEMDTCAGTVPQKPNRPRGRPGSAGTSHCCFLNTQPRQESNRTRPPPAQQISAGEASCSGIKFG